MTTDDLPVLGVGRFPVSGDILTYSAVPAEYRRQLARQQREISEQSGRPQAPVRDTTLGDRPAVGNDIDRIVVPLSADVEARQLNISAVHGRHRYVLSLFVKLGSAEADARQMLDEVGSSWVWK